MDIKYGIIFILIVAVVVLGVMYGLKTCAPCEVCPTCATCEVCPMCPTYRLSIGDKKQSLLSLNEMYSVSVVDGNLLFTYTGKSATEFKILGYIGVGSTTGTEYSCNEKGQIQMFDKDKLIFSYPQTPPLTTYKPYYIYVSNDGELICTDTFDNSIIWRTRGTSFYDKFDNTDIAGSNIGGGVVGSYESCEKSCNDTPGCIAFTMDNNKTQHCFLKRGTNNPIAEYKPDLKTYYNRSFAIKYPLQAAIQPTTQTVKTGTGVTN